jgi:hypothetical protein
MAAMESGPNNAVRHHGQSGRPAQDSDAVLHACTNARNPGPIKRAMGREG